MTVENTKPNIISIAGRSGSGKTTLLEKLIPHLKKKGYRLGVIKHAHCGVEMDKTGKDSWRHKNAGAAATLVISPGLIAMVKDYGEIYPSNREAHSFESKPDFIESKRSTIDDEEDERDIIANESATIESVKHYLSDMDLVIVEGFKYASLPKLEIFRAAAGHHTPLFLEDTNLVAFITDSDIHTTLPRFGLDDAESIADFIEKKYIL